MKSPRGAEVSVDARAALFQSRAWELRDVQQKHFLEGRSEGGQALLKNKKDLK